MIKMNVFFKVSVLTVVIVAHSKDWSKKCYPFPGRAGAFPCVKGKTL